MTTDLTPEFTTSLRGYDRIQVDDYVDTLREWLDAATARMQAAEADAAQMHDQMLRLRQRVGELEADAGQLAPRSLAAVGDRVARILALAQESAQAAEADAEAAATDIVIKAQQEAEELIRATRSRQVEAEAWLAQTTRKADQLVAQAEERAGLAAAQLTSDANARAAAAEAQAEQRAADLIAGAEAEAARLSEATRAERARALQELAARREALSAQIAGLEAQRDEVLAALTGLRESLHRTIGQLPAAVAPARASEPPMATDEAAAAAHFEAAPADHFEAAAAAHFEAAPADHFEAAPTGHFEAAPTGHFEAAPTGYGASEPSPARGGHIDLTQAMPTSERRPDDTQLFDQNEVSEAAGSQ
jgi:cell division septum initiation protein DivIVA